MADEQVQPQPTFLDKFSLDAKTLWNNHKLFLIFFGGLILIVKFRDVLIDILVSSSKKLLQDTKDKDTVLAGEEQKAKDDANALVQKAKEEPLKEKPVDDDWYKNNK